MNHEEDHQKKRKKKKKKKTDEKRVEPQPDSSDSELDAESDITDLERAEISSLTGIPIFTRVYIYFISIEISVFSKLDYGCGLSVVPKADRTRILSPNPSESITETSRSKDSPTHHGAAHSATIVVGQVV